ncbi:hypothetical protein THAOC_36153 [Thalassiosira oceanica]|uniref:RRM domain-containing protein n=1 Tax=Thalassiosira oceanica TaxID=159749 RepID=K0R8W7_THAOC|nr:hypothetical protein THAOC_36153 [Thalassiosira oceanica]|eukprot:EJK45236.1 hypothetical protein THAOC_36153 [Thalassiosira oceanica]
MSLNSTDTRAMEQRRCLLLATIGSTAETMPSNPTLEKLLQDGLLVTIKSWLDDILSGRVGGMDLLLHLLSNIIPLPVTKEMVTTSRLGKLVSSVEKHTICVGSPNESAIKARINQVKERWSASVKARRNSANASKRQLDSSSSQQPPAKKAKASSSLSNLLKKVDGSSNDKPSPAVQGANQQMKEQAASSNDTISEPVPKKDKRRIHWADGMGKTLAVSNNDGESSQAKQEPKRKSRWADRKKKDLLHEKEMLLQSRKSGAANEDKEEMLNAMAMIALWKTPQASPTDPSNPPVTVMSNELNVQDNRMRSVPGVHYSTEADVPFSPTLLSEVEKALEVFNNAPPTVVPFFSPQSTAAAAAAVAPPQQSAMNSVPQGTSFPPPNPSQGADLNTVLMLGLPMFLVGSNIQALQMLASNPGLLNSFKDANGVFNQPGLMNLVQTLTQNVAPPPAQTAPPPQVGTQVAGLNPYGSMPPSATNHQIATSASHPPPQHHNYMTSHPPPPQQNYMNFPPPPPQPEATSTRSQSQPMNGYRGDQNGSEANLHLSGYGPTTTNEEIIALFSPYVHVTEVVNKNGFSFVNTIDPEGSRRAKEALHGALLGGMPCRINNATRKARITNFGGSGPEDIPMNGAGQVDYDQVKDDRGNPATKNLFVAGYGPGTSEQQLKDVFGQHGRIVSVIKKSSFSFVNTSDKSIAVMARAALIGKPLNGGAMRINFAKETGRLGTSFDGGYGGGGSNHYGRYGSTMWNTFQIRLHRQNVSGELPACAPSS